MAMTALDGSGTTPGVKWYWMEIVPEDSTKTSERSLILTSPLESNKISKGEVPSTTSKIAGSKAVPTNPGSANGRPSSATKKVWEELIKVSNSIGSPGSSTISNVLVPSPPKPIPATENWPDNPVPTDPNRSATVPLPEMEMSVNEIVNDSRVPNEESKGVAVSEKN